MDNPVEVGRRLREAREARGISQRGLAFPGCSPAYISRIEAGDRTPSLHLLRELGARLGVSEAWLAEGKEATAAALLRDAEVALRLDDLDLAQELFQRVLDEEGPEGDRAARAQALEQLGQIALQQSNVKQAIELFRQALEVSGEDEVDRPSLAANLARAYAQMGELAPAISILERSLQRHSGDPIQYVRFATLLGAALTDNGDVAGAERVVAGALSRGREVSDPYTRARLYWSQSRLMGEQGRPAEAEEYASKTLEIMRATEDTNSIALLMQALAHINLDLGRPGDAMEYLREGRPLIESSGTPLQITQFRIEEARALAAVGEAEEAAALAMELTNLLGDAHPVDKGRSYVLLAEVIAEVGQRERAREIYELAIELLEQAPHGRYLVKAYKGLATLLRELGDTQAALDLLERTLEVQAKTGRPLT